MMLPGGNASPSDPTLGAMSLFDEPSAWDRTIENVPIFVEHRAVFRNDDGSRREIVVDEARLHRIAERINRLWAERGVPVHFHDGHTADPVAVAQKDQPPIVAYGKGARVGRWGPQQRLGILTTLYVKKGCDPVVRERPFRSAEFYDATDEITAVALLRTDPKLDMGALIYARGDGSVHYRRGGACYHYTETPTMPEPTPPAAPPQIDPARAEEFKRYAAHCYPHLDRMHTEHAARYGAGGPPAPAPAPAAPSGTNTQVPALVAPARHEEEVARMQRESDAVRYAAQEQRIATMEAELRGQRIAYQRSLAERECVQLEAEGYELDRPAEVDRMGGTPDGRLPPMTAEQRAAHIAYVRKYHRRAPVGRDFVPVAGAGHEGGKAPRKAMTVEQRDKALAYMDAHGVTYEAALEKVLAA